MFELPLLIHCTIFALQVINDCIGFAGPLLLNKLIKFLQEGYPFLHKFLFLARDGYLIDEYYAKTVKKSIRFHPKFPSFLSAR